MVAGGGGGGGDDEEGPRRPKEKDEEEEEDDDDDEEEEEEEEEEEGKGQMGRKEFNLPSVESQLIIWPKGCTFGVRRLNCTQHEKKENGTVSCRPLIFAMEHIREVESCGGTGRDIQVGQNPGAGKRKRGVTSKLIREKKCIVSATEDCSLPGGKTEAVCVNASALIDDASFFTLNIYVAKTAGTYMYAGEEYDIEAGQTKFTVVYKGETCCSNRSLSCFCLDGEAGAIDFGIRLINPPGKPSKLAGYSHERQMQKFTIGQTGEASIEFPNVVSNF